MYTRCNTKRIVFQAIEDKDTAVIQAGKTAAKAELAERLISNLADERVRWSEKVLVFGEAEGEHVLVHSS